MDWGILFYCGSGLSWYGTLNGRPGWEDDEADDRLQLLVLDGVGFVR